MVKNPCANADVGNTDSIPASRRSLRRRMTPTPVFLPGKSHGQRCLVGQSLCKDLDMTEHAHTQSKIILTDKL